MAALEARCCRRMGRPIAAAGEYFADIRTLLLGERDVLRRETSVPDQTSNLGPLRHLLPASLTSIVSYVSRLRIATSSRVGGE